MRYFFNAAKLLLLDLASTILFVAIFLLTHNIYLSIGLGVALGLAQIGIQFARSKPIETMEWLSLFLVIAATTRDAGHHQRPMTVSAPTVTAVNTPAIP